MSKTLYNEVEDETKGTNIMLIVNEKFENLDDIQVVQVGDIEPEWGFSSVKLVPSMPLLAHLPSLHHPLSRAASPAPQPILLVRHHGGSLTYFIELIGFVFKGSNDMVALKVYEVNGVVQTKMTVFDLNGQFKLKSHHQQQHPNQLKEAEAVVKLIKVSLPSLDLLATSPLTLSSWVFWPA